MKRMKLRMWVKVVFALVIICGIIMIGKVQTDKAVNQCVNAGHSINYCETGLR